MTTVLLALHYQNDVLHEEGKISVGFEKNSTRREGVIRSAKNLLQQARQEGIVIVHVRVAYRADYADLSENAPIMQGVKRLQAVQENSWGSEFFEGLVPLAHSQREFVVTHKRINAFYASTLEAILSQFNPTHLVIAGVATHSVVESTVRHAVDMGFYVTVPAQACGAPEATHQAALKSMALIAHIYEGDEMVQVFSREGGQA